MVTVTTIVEVKRYFYGKCSCAVLGHLNFWIVYHNNHTCTFCPCFDECL